MKFLLGLVVVFGSVIGGFLLSHGKILAIWQPVEILIICGAAIGAFIIANPAKTIKATLASLPGVLKGSRYNKALCLELLSLLFEIATKIRKSGLMSLEQDLDAPQNSTLFGNAPRLLKDHHFMDFISDNLRVLVTGNLQVHEFESLLDQELEVHHHESLQPAEAIGRLADAMPGFGIVAAVLGIVITMSLIGGDPKQLGVHIAAALVGTFMGILFAYGLIGPIGLSVGCDAEREGKFYQCIKVFLLSVASGVAPILTVEYARRTLPSDMKPGFLELEEHVKKKPSGAEGAASADAAPSEPPAGG